MSRVTYDAAAQNIEIDLDGHSILVDGLANALFARQDAEGTTHSALWITSNEADVLVKMIEYILAKVKIKEESRSTLEAILPRARGLTEASTESTE